MSVFDYWTSAYFANTISIAIYHASNQVCSYSLKFHPTSFMTYSPAMLITDSIVIIRGRCLCYLLILFSFSYTLIQLFLQGYAFSCHRFDKRLGILQVFFLLFKLIYLVLNQNNLFTCIFCGDVNFLELSPRHDSPTIYYCEKVVSKIFASRLQHFQDIYPSLLVIWT